MKTSRSVEQFGKAVSTGYHNEGHIILGEDCDRHGEGVMGYTSVAARDPIFYRWHGHLEELMQQFRDKQEKYTKQDFQLSDEVEVANVHTRLPMYKIDNILLTHWENV